VSTTPVHEQVLEAASRIAGRDRTFRMRDVVFRLSSPLSVYGHEVSVLSLEGLERAKRAAGRHKDLIDVAEIREIRRRTGQ
jgi:hypothetical protein